MLPSEHLIKAESKRVEIGPRIVSDPFKRFRWKVGKGSHATLELIKLRLISRKKRQSEISQANLLFTDDEDVLRFEIAVNDARRVNKVERLKRLS